MGKHSASGGTPRSTPAQQQPTVAAPTRSPVTPLPAAVQQTIVFGAVAALVAAVALIWAGVNGRTAFLVGLGLIVIGAIAFFVLHRAGLIAGPDKPRPTAPPEQHL
jgi:hypothetical protein